jgi:hypothetical protein
MDSPVFNTIKNVAGYGVGTLAALDTIKSGGLGSYLMNRQRLMSDPGFRSSLAGSPFAAGVFGVSGATGPAPAAPSLPAAVGGGGVAQPADMVGPPAPGVQVAAPGQAAPGQLPAPSALNVPGYLPGTPRAWMPNLPPYDPEQALKQQGLATLEQAAGSADQSSQGILQRGLAKTAAGIMPTQQESTAVLGRAAQIQAAAGPGSTVTVDFPGMKVTQGSPYNMAAVGADEYPTYAMALAAAQGKGPGWTVIPSGRGTFLLAPPPTREQELPMTPPAPAKSGEMPGAPPSPVMRGGTPPPGAPGGTPGPTASAVPPAPTVSAPVIYPAPKGFVFHHSGGSTLAGLTTTLADRGLGSEYVMDRDGTIYSYAGQGSPHIRPNDQFGGIAPGLTNSNALGMEVVAKDNNDVTPAQITSAQKFMADNYPTTPVYGHGEVNPGHKQATEGMAIVSAIRNDRGMAVASTPTTRPSVLGGGIAYAAAPPPGATVTSPPPPAPAAPSFDPDATVPHVLVPAPAPADATVGFPSPAPGPAQGVIVPQRIPTLRAPAPPALPGATAPPGAAVLPGTNVDPATGLPLTGRTYESKTGSETFTAPPRGDDRTQMLMRKYGITDWAQASPKQIDDYLAEDRALKIQDEFDKAVIARTQRAPSAEEARISNRYFTMKRNYDDFITKYPNPEDRAKFLGVAWAPWETLLETVGWRNATAIRDFRNAFSPFSLESLTDEKGKAQPGFEGIAQTAPSASDSAPVFESNLHHFGDLLNDQITLDTNTAALPVGARTPAVMQSLLDQMRANRDAARQAESPPPPEAPPEAPAAPPPPPAAAAAPPPPAAATAQPWVPNWVH